MGGTALDAPTAAFRQMGRGEDYGLCSCPSFFYEVRLGGGIQLDTTRYDSAKDLKVGMIPYSGQPDTGVL